MVIIDLCLKQKKTKPHNMNLWICCSLLYTSFGVMAGKQNILRALVSACSIS